MTVAYIDTSAFLATALGESAGGQVAARLDTLSSLVSSNLLEAEVRAAFFREGVEFHPGILAEIQWVTPDRPLTRELEAVLAAGYLRGADLWHLATALYLAPDPSSITFVTLDARQRYVADALGFQT